MQDQFRNLSVEMRHQLDEMIERPALFAVSPSVAEGKIFELTCVVLACEQRLAYSEALGRVWDAWHEMLDELGGGDREAFRFLCQTDAFSSSASFPEPHAQGWDENVRAFHLLSDRSRDLCRRIGLADASPLSS